MTNMCVEIGYVFGYDVSGNLPSDLKVKIFAYTTGSSINKLLTDWIPGLGVAVDRSSAVLCTEEVGWDAASYFDSL